MNGNNPVPDNIFKKIIAFEVGQKPNNFKQSYSPRLEIAGTLVLWNLTILKKMFSQIFLLLRQKLIFAYKNHKYHIN